MVKMFLKAVEFLKMTWNMLRMVSSVVMVVEFYSEGGKIQYIFAL